MGAGVLANVTNVLRQICSDERIRANVFWRMCVLTNRACGLPTASPETVGGLPIGASLLSIINQFLAAKRPP